MANLLDKMFRKKKVDVQKPAFAPVARPKYDFVEQYTILDPKKVLNGGYEYWRLCEKVPVACEESSVSSCGFINCIELPTKIVMGFLGELQQKTSEEIADPKKRTLTIVNLSENYRMVIQPLFNMPEKAQAWLYVDKNADRKDWILHVTPEKNRAIIDALKIHTR